MQSSRPIPIVGETRLQLLARFDQNPEQAKAIAKGAGISEITLHDWATTYKTSGDLGEAPPPEAPQGDNRQGPRKGGRGRGYSHETRMAAVQACLNGEGSSETIGKRFGTSGRSIRDWLVAYQKGELKPGKNESKSSMVKKRRSFTEEFRYDVAKGVDEGNFTIAAAAARFDLSPGLVSGWVKLLRTKKLKPPRGKPGPKPKPKTEIVEEYGQTSLALPTAPRTQLARVTTTHDEIARLKAENERLKYVLRKTQAMLLGDE